MSLYLLLDGIHTEMDKEVYRFFSHGPNEKKYHMVQWAQVCDLIDQGGVGIIASQAINVALALKWVWMILCVWGPLA